MKNAIAAALARLFVRAFHVTAGFDNSTRKALDLAAKSAHAKRIARIS